jgi:phosphate starvation-inducible PhoH-like protein
MNFRFHTTAVTTVLCFLFMIRSFSASKKLHLATTRLGKTIQQRVYLDYLQQSNVSLVLAVGCAGTGKTWLACQEAAQTLKRGDVDKIVLTRPIVPVDGEEGIGFLPGSLESKMDPWTRPMLDALRPLLPPLVLQKQVEMIPLMYMRGRTFDRAFVIADEMQNSTPEQMLMLVTRIGNHSRLVITGDPQQTDRVSAKSTTPLNGLSDLVQRIQQKAATPLTHIRMVHLTTEDVQRSGLVAELLEHVYQQQPQQHQQPKSPGIGNPVGSKDCALIIDDPYLRRRTSN